jgi:hypothetical protein
MACGLQLLVARALDRMAAYGIGYAILCFLTCSLLDMPLAWLLSWQL